MKKLILIGAIVILFTTSSFAWPGMPSFGSTSNTQDKKTNVNQEDIGFTKGLGEQVNVNVLNNISKKIQDGLKKVGEQTSNVGEEMSPINQQVNNAVKQSSHQMNNIRKTNPVKDITKNDKVVEAVTNLRYGVSFANPFTSLLRNNIQGITFNNPYHYGLGYLVVTRLQTLTTPEVIKDGSEQLKCYKKLKGYYVNTLVGNVLIPLDEDTKTLISSKINIDGGLYTSCSGGETNAVYGMLKYKIGAEQYALYAGLKYDVEDGKIDTTKGFAPTLTLMNGIIPVGLIYDSYSKVGFVGGDVGLLVVDSDVLTGSTGVVGGRLLMEQLQTKMNQGNIENLIKGVGTNQLTIGNISIYKNNLGLVKSAIGIQGMASLSDANYQNRNESKYISAQTMLNNVSLKGQSQRGYVTKGLINLSNIFNLTTKNTAKLCRGKWQEISNITLTYTDINKLPKEECLKLSNNAKVVIDYDVSQQSYAPLLIVKGDGTTQVIIKKSMIGKNDLQLYLDKGQLLISNDINLVNIDKNGDYTSHSSKVVTSGAILKGVYVIKGLIGGTDGSYQNKDFKHKLYVDGTMASLNTVDVPIEGRVNYVNDLLGINDIDKINLQTEFSWYCKDTGVGTDGVSCDNQEDKWRENSLIFKTRYYNSELLK